MVLSLLITPAVYFKLAGHKGQTTLESQPAGH
jgi:hypothetical protein